MITLIDTLTNSPHYLRRKLKGETNENLNFDVRVYGIGFSQRSLYVDDTTNELFFSVFVYHVFVFDIEYLLG